MDNNLTFHVSSRSRFATISSVQPKKKKNIFPPFIFIISSNTRFSWGRKEKERNCETLKNEGKKRNKRKRKTDENGSLKHFKTFAFNLTDPSYFHLKQTPTSRFSRIISSVFFTVCHQSPHLETAGYFCFQVINSNGT